MGSARDELPKALRKWLTRKRPVTVRRGAIDTPRMGSTTNQDHDVALC